MNVLSPRVYEKRLLTLEPQSPIAIKRSVHTIGVSAGAAPMVASFTRVLEEPGRLFGLIELVRTEDKRGRPYALGERFQGRFVITEALEEQLRVTAREELARLATSIVRSLRLDGVFARVEGAMFSDYSVITDLDLSPQPGRPYRLRYDYLEGTPIAGYLCFECHDLGDGSCRFIVTSEYQEISLPVLLVYGTAVLKMHERVLYEIVRQAAAAIGAGILRTDIPAAYCGR